MASLSGQAELATARIDNLTGSLGQGITHTLEFQDALKTVNEILGSISLNINEVQKKLANGVSPQQLAQEEASSPFNLVMDFFKDQSLPLPKAGLYVYDLLTQDFETANNRFLESIRGAGKRRQEELEKQFEATKKTLDQQNKAAFSQSINNQIKIIEQDLIADGKKRIKEIEDEQEKTKKSLSWRLSTGSSDDIGLNQSKIRQLFANSNLFEVDEFNQKLAQLEQNTANSIEKAQNKIKDFEKTFISIFENVNSRFYQDNPIARAMMEGDKATRQLQESLKTLPAELQEIGKKAVAMQESFNADNVFKARLDNALQVANLQDQADRFRNAGNVERDKKLRESIEQRYGQGNYEQGILTDFFLMNSNSSRLSQDSLVSMLARQSKSDNLIFQSRKIR